MKKGSKHTLAVRKRMLRGTPEGRFWAKVHKTASCWEWIGGKTNVGYGRFRSNGLTGGQLVYAHRFSYELHKSKIPAGLFLLHSCDNPPCVNPAHLFPGTPRDNSHDSIRKGRGALGKKHRKLSPEERAEIIRLRKSGFTVLEVSKMKRVCIKTANNYGRKQSVHS